MAIIDLGVLGSASEPGEPDPARGLWRAWRVGPELRIGGLVALLVATMVSAAPLARPIVVSTIPADLGAVRFTNGDQLFVIGRVPGDTDGAAGGRDDDQTDRPEGPPAVDVLAGGDGERVIAAYQLPEVRGLWQVPLPVADLGARRGRLGYQFTDDETLLVSAFDLTGAAGTAALDTRTGAVIWRAGGMVSAVTVGGNAVLWSPAGSADPNVARALAGAAVLRGVDAATGEPRWSLALPVGSETGFDLVDERLRRLVEITPAGGARVRDPETGQVLRSAGLLKEHSVRPGRITVVAGLLIVHSDDDTVVGYGVERLEWRWSIGMNAGAGRILPCGDELCVVSEPTGVRVLDPHGGTTRWFRPDWSMLDEIDGHLLVTAPPARLEETVVVDLVTGAVLGELPRWRLIGKEPGSGAWLVRYADAGEAWIARLDAKGVRPRAVARLTGVSGDCVAARDVIICRRIDGSLGTWRIPPSAR